MASWPRSGRTRESDPWSSRSLGCCGRSVSLYPSYGVLVNVTNSRNGCLGYIHLQPLSSADKRDFWVEPGFGDGFWVGTSELAFSFSLGDGCSGFPCAHHSRGGWTSAVQPLQ